MAQRHQNGHLRKAKRRSGPVWEFLWRETGADGKRHQRTLVIGSVKEFRTERDALAQIQTVRTNINRDSFPTSALLTFSGLADHYRKTELVSGTKTAKTQEIYRVYLSRWIEPRWGCDYLHSIKPVLVEAWLRSLPLADGSKAKIRNIISAVFSHGIRYELTDKNPIKAVRQSAGRAKVPLLLDVSEIYRLFDVLALRERSMVITDALTGIRRGELMGLKWEDLDFIGHRIKIVRSVVDCTTGPCKTEASRKHVPMDEHIAQVLMAWRQESVYTKPEDWVWASPHKQGQEPYWPQTIMQRFIRPAAVAAGITKRIGWHTFRHTFLNPNGIARSGGQSGARADATRFIQDDYGQLHSCPDEPKRQAQKRLADLIMQTGKVGHA